MKHKKTHLTYAESTKGLDHLYVIVWRHSSHTYQQNDGRVSQKADGQRQFPLHPAATRPHKLVLDLRQTELLHHQVHVLVYRKVDMLLVSSRLIY